MNIYIHNLCDNIQFQMALCNHVNRILTKKLIIIVYVSRKILNKRFEIKSTYIHSLRMKCPSSNY